MMAAVKAMKGVRITHPYARLFRAVKIGSPHFLLLVSFARGIAGTLGSSLGRPTAALAARCAVARAVAVPVRTAARGGNAHRAAVQAGQGHGRAPL